MPNPAVRRGEQWELCAICGFLWPLSQLSIQKGAYRCYRCIDDLTIERHPMEVMRVLGANPEVENKDERYVDQAFFNPNEEQI